MDIASIISKNLTAWMTATPSLDTFKKLSAKSGVGFGTVQRAKNGDGNITADKLTAIAAAFGRTPAELMTPSDEEGAESTGFVNQTLSTGAELDRVSAEAHAKVLIEQAGEVLALWTALPPERRAEVLRQLREEAGAQAGEGRILTPRSRKSSGATFPDTKERREAD